MASLTQYSKARVAITTAFVLNGTAAGAILARDTFDATPFISTLPYIVFSAAMVIGRLFGDRLAHKFSPVKLIIGGGLIAGVGLSLGLLIGGVNGMIFGWFASGLGLSTVIPMLFSQAGEIAKTRFDGQFAPSEGVAMVSGIAYFGFLAGSPSLFWAIKKARLKNG